MHLRTRLVCSEIIYISFEKVRDIFLQDFERFVYWKSGKIAKENIKATGKKKFQYFKFERAPSQNIKTRTSGVRQ